MATRHIIFLYGTLKSGQPNFRVLSDAKTGITRFLGIGQTVKRYPMVVTPQYLFPFLLPVEGKGEHVEGEIYEVSDSKLKRLDEFEGHPDFYLRLKVPIALTLCKNHNLAETIDCKNHNPAHLPETVDCWVYFLPQFEPELIELPFLKKYAFNSDEIYSEDV